MKYIINGVATYNSADGTLFCPENRLDMLTLNRVSNELLLLFVKNNGVLLRRETILNELWESKGLSASSNNLNNHVSMLRKALAQCGFTHLITTIPKHGFMFEAETLVVVDKEEKAAVVSPVDPQALSPLSEQAASDDSAPIFDSTGLTKGKVFFLVIFLGALLIVVGAYNHFWQHPARTPVFSLDQCRFYLAGDKAQTMARSEAINAIHTIIRRKPLDCTRAANIYFLADKAIDSVGKAFTNHLVVYCPYDSKLPCDNYYFFNYENKDEK